MSPVAEEIRQALDYGKGLQRCGLGYRGEYEGGVEMSVGRLRVSGGEVKGELTVRIGGTHLCRGTYNLSSFRARADTARVLASKSGDVAWPDILERFALCVLTAEQAGEQVVVIGQRTRSAKPLRLMPPLLPLRSATTLYGPGGAGKSTVATAILVAAASGRAVIPGWLPIRASPVLVLDYETTGDEWSNRAAAIAEGAGLEQQRILYLRGTRPLADMVERLAELITQHAIELLVVDSVALATGGGREGGGAEETTLRLHAALRVLDVTTLLVDHVAAVDLHAGNNASSKPYGSIFKMYQSRDNWELRREQEPQGGTAELLLLNPKVNDTGKLAPIGLRVIHDGEVIRFERGWVTAPELEQRLPTRERMRGALASGAMTTKALAAQLNIRESSIRTALARSPDIFVRTATDRIGVKV